MFIDGITTFGFAPGTYKLGQKLYATRLNSHYYHVKNSCGFCGGMGTIIVEGVNKATKEVECPVCHGKNKDD